MASGFETVAGVLPTSLTDAFDTGNAWFWVGEGGWNVEVPIRAGRFWSSTPSPPVSPNALLHIAASSEVGELLVDLQAFAGTAAHLLGRRDPDGYTRVAAVPTLAATVEAAARWSLLRETLGADPEVPHQCALDRHIAGLDPAEVRRRTAILQLLIEDRRLPDAAHPATSTSSVLTDPELLAVVADALEEATPGRLAARIALLEQPFCDGYATGMMTLPLERRRGGGLNVSGGSLFEFTQPGHGRHANISGSDSFSFECTGDLAHAMLSGERHTLTFPTRYIGGVPQQVEGRSITTGIRHRRIGTWPWGFVMADMQEQVLSFPNHPQLPSEHVVAEGLSSELRPAGLDVFAPASIDGLHLLPTRSVMGYVEANRMLLQADGGGVDLEQGLALTWALDDDGAVELEFHDSQDQLVRSARVIAFRAEAAGVADVLAIVRSPEGETAVHVGHALRPAPAAHWLVDTEVPGYYVTFAGRTAGQVSPYSYWALWPDRNAWQWTIHNGAFPGVKHYWSRPHAGTVVLRRCVGADGQDVPILDREPSAGECTLRYQRREWSVFRVSEACYYVHEDSRVWIQSDPASGVPSNGGAAEFSRGQVYAFSIDDPRWWSVAGWRRGCALPDSISGAMPDPLPQAPQPEGALGDPPRAAVRH
jgi:hypothetical protein